MKKDRNKLQDNQVNLRFKKSDYDRLLDACLHTTCRSFSEYLRSIVLSKPVIVNTRNHSLDEFKEELIQLKNTLNAAGKNIQAAEQTLFYTKLEEFKSLFNKLF